MLETNFPDAPCLPLTVKVSQSDKSLDALIDLTANEREFFRENLSRCGALLFRGFDLKTVAEFENFARRFSGKELFNYAGGVSPRRSLGTGIYTSTEYPPELTLALHNELCYSKNYPRFVYFFCLVAPESGGATTLGDSRRILRNIAPEIVASFVNKNVRYDRFLQSDENSDYSWQAAFETGEKKTVEKICRAADADFEWLPSDVLRVSQTRPATATHPETGEEVWFNQADGFHESNLDEETKEFFNNRNEPFRLNSCFGDGAPIADETLRQIRRVLNTETVPHNWRAGDVLILDNILTAHGRMPFAGARKIAVAMT